MSAQSGLWFPDNATGPFWQFEARPSATALQASSDVNLFAVPRTNLPFCKTGVQSDVLSSTRPRGGRAAQWGGAENVNVRG